MKLVSFKLSVVLMFAALVFMTACTSATTQPPTIAVLAPTATLAAPTTTPSPTDTPTTTMTLAPTNTPTTTATTSPTDTPTATRVPPTATPKPKPTNIPPATYKCAANQGGLVVRNLSGVGMSPFRIARLGVVLANPEPGDVFADYNIPNGGEVLICRDVDSNLFLNFYLYAAQFAGGGIVPSDLGNQFEPGKIELLRVYKPFRRDCAPKECDELTTLSISS